MIEFRKTEIDGVYEKVEIKDGKQFFITHLNVSVGQSYTLGPYRRVNVPRDLLPFCDVNMDDLIVQKMHEDHAIIIKAPTNHAWKGRPTKMGNRICIQEEIANKLKLEQGDRVRFFILGSQLCFDKATL
jgi:hypothetical protein